MDMAEIIESAMKLQSDCDTPPLSRGCQWTVNSPRDQRKCVAALACQNSFLLTGRRGLERITLQTCCV